MNYLEFKRQLMVDPYDRSPDFEEALKVNSDCAAAAAKSDSFEAILQSAINVPVPEDLVSLAINQRNKELPKPQIVSWLPAMAAGLAMGIGLTTAVFLFNKTSDQNVEHHLADHWMKDGDITLQQAAINPMDNTGISQVLATLNLEADDELMGNIIYARNCGTPHGNGVHMVMRTDAGMVTVVYMPEADVKDGKRIHVASNEALLTQMERGSIAIIGSEQQNLDSRVQFVKANLKENQRINT